MVATFKYLKQRRRQIYLSQEVPPSRRALLRFAARHRSGAPLLLLLLLLLCARMHDDAPLRRIAFGSCRKQAKPQPVWDAVAATEPELWLWTGDSIYPQTPTTPELLRSAYESAEADRGYRAMLSSTRLGIEGVYDDHDFGENDGGRWYS